MTLSSDSISYRTLEWQRLLEYAQKEAYTFPAKNRLRQLENPLAWASNVYTARAWQSETQEIIALLDRDALWGPLFELDDPTDILDRLSKGSVLEIAELALLRRWLYAVDSWTQIPRDEIKAERFKKALTQLSDPLNILRILDQVLTPQGELSEKASPKLSSLFSEIRSLKKEIGNVLDNLLKTFSQRGILQENFSDVRDGRYVIPIKISCQNEIDGIIYEASASRQTVFVEPKEVASLNNRLRQRQNDLIQEIFIVLENTSKQIRNYAPEMSKDVEILVYWDAVQAKCRLGRHYSGKTIRVSEEKYFNLKQTAHPLLWWSLPSHQIIRNDIEFGQPAKTLLLTGPNTGGKTVLLKTLGLAGICARTGFPFPAIDVPTIPFFDAFFADLGDPQSIEQHLSSFSGHVMRFKDILHGLTDQSLVLIDELNSATDPEEGAAFGRAVLETIMSRDAMIVTTTHDPHLKALAITDPRIQNASMEFNEDSRSPTFKMVIGVPGRSRALETAERLGMPSAVIELAKKYISREHQVFENLLSKLESDIQETSRARREAIQLREEAEKLKREWTQRTEASVNEMMERTRQRLRRILEQAQDEVRSSVKKLDELKNRREIDKTRSQLNETLAQSVSKLDSALEEEAPEIAKALSIPSQAPQKLESTHPPKLSPGMSVRIPKWKNTGSVIEVTGNKVKVAMGTLQMTLSTEEVEPLSPSAAAKSQSQFRVKTPESFSPPPQIDIRGERFEEAMGSLERYLDLAFRSGSLVEVTIVHGLGTGALREGTHKLLHKLPYVKGFRDGGAGHGGTGATIVEFDRE